jgi:predicted metalloprotease
VSAAVPEGDGVSYGYDRWSTGYPYRRRRRRRSGCLLTLARVVVFFCVVGVIGSIAQQWFSGPGSDGGSAGGDTGWFPDGPTGGIDGDDSGSDGGVDDFGEGSGDRGDTGAGDPGPASGNTVLTRNPFYTVGGLAAIDCPAPSLASSSTVAQRGYDEQIFGCLVDAWRPPLRKAGLTTQSPRIYVFDSPGTSPCGTFRPRSGSVLAFYCPVGATLYVDVQQMARAFPPNHHIAYALVLAHEYGHHLQNAAGILEAEDATAYARPSDEMELSRRTEVQASCFAGMFVRSIEESYPVTGVQREAFEYYATHAFGDSASASPSRRSHGSPGTQGNWIARGFNDNDTGDCNSFRAPSSQVQ